MVALFVLPALQELFAIPQCLPWKKETKEGSDKPTKVPCNLLTGYPCASNKPENWYPFAPVMEAVNAGRFDGLGFAPSKEDDIVLLDLDNARAPDGTPTPWAQEVMACIHTYWEDSPSKTGYRGVARCCGGLPANLGADVENDGACRIEMKQSGGYMTITGWHVEGTPTHIVDCTDELHRLYHEARNRRRAAKTKVKAEMRREHTALHPIHGAAGDTAYGLKAIGDECADLASTPEGGRNTLLNKIAFRLGQLVGGNELKESTVERELMAAALRSGLSESEIEKTLRSGLESGKLQPRSAPPRKRLALIPIKRDEDTSAAPSFSHIALTGEEFDALSPDEKRAAYQEMQAFVGGMLNCIYARQAKPATRIVAADALVTTAQRTVKGLSEHMTDAMPVCISQEYGVAEKLGLHGNSVTAAYKAMARADIIDRYYEEDEQSDRQHLRIALTTAFLMNVSALADKKPRESKTEKLQTTSTGAHCPECGSGDITLFCRACSEFTELGNVQTEVPFANESANEPSFANEPTNFVESFLPIEERDYTNFVAPFANENESANEPANEPEPLSQLRFETEVVQPPAPQSEEAQLDALGERLNFPRLELAPWSKVAPGRENWQKFKRFRPTQVAAMLAAALLLIGGAV